MNAYENLLTRDSVLEALKKRGVAKAEVRYSGGGDEGDVNEIVLFDASDNKIGELDICYGSSNVWDKVTEKYVTKYQVNNDDERLAQGLCGPVYDRYDTFAGEFYVDGTITWDVINGTVKDSGVVEDENEKDFDEFI